MQFKRRLFAFSFCFCWLWFRFFISCFSFGFKDHLTIIIYKFNSIVSSVKKLINISQYFFYFSDLFLIFIFLRDLLNSSSLCCASLINIPRFLILSRKATGSFNLPKSVSLPLLLIMNFKSHNQSF